MRDEHEKLYGETRREMRKERKLLQARDRSKYKKTDKREKEPPPPGCERGRILSVESDGIIVDINHEKRVCTLKGALKQEKTRQKNLVIIGDFVHVDKTTIVYVEQRRSVLSRAEHFRRRQEQLIAANIDQVFIVVSLLTPQLKPALVDRYIIATKKGNMEPIILLNKVDILDNPPSHIPPEEVKEQRLLKADFMKSYSPIIEVSTTQNLGIDAILEKMHGKTSVFAGQSGVGKSSIINALFDLDLPVGEMVEKTRKGSHTTTSAHLVPTPGDGFCIDTPGIKSFGLWDVNPQELEHFFPEIQEYSGQCKFLNCTHIHEPECSVRAALESGKISRLRYDSYRTLFEGTI